MKPGRPYIIFLPFGQNSNTQVIALSRRVLNINDHSDLIDPIIKFIKDGKKLRKMFKNYGITGGIGYDKDISNFRTELIQVAAVAFQIIEWFDKNKLQKNGRNGFTLLMGQDI